MAELTYREILPQRAVDDNSFSRGVQNFIWSLGNPTSCIMNKSYFRFEVEVNGDRAGAVPLLSNLVAPADNAISCLYNNVQFYAGGRQVSQCINGCPQASQCKARLMESSATLETLGADAKLFEGEFMKRQQMVCGDAQKSSLSPDRDMRPITNVMANQRTATIAIDIAGAVVGVNTTLGDFAAGDTLVVGDLRFQFQEITSDTAAVITPAPVQAIPAETDAYVIKQTPEISKGANKFFVMWCPPIGAFDLDHNSPLPPGDYRIAMNPSQDYKSAAIETLLGSQATPANPNYYDFKVKGVRFYLATIKTSVPQTLNATIYEQEVQSKPFTTASNTLNFTIPASTRAISVFFQSDSAGKNTLIPPTKFQTFPNGGVEKPALTLENIQLTYANQTKPSVRWESNYDQATLTNELQQRYYDTYLHAGMLGASGGIDRFEEFLEKGLLIHYSWDRDSDDRSTELQVSASFSQALGAGSSMYVVAWYSRVLAIDSVAGQVREVLTRTA